MKCKNIIFLIGLFGLASAHSNSSSASPCDYKKCDLNEVACLEIIPKCKQKFIL